MDNPSIFVTGSQPPQRTTLLAWVQALTRQGHSEREIEIEVLESVESGRVVLIGSFRAMPLRSLRPAGRGAGRGGSSDGVRTQTRPKPSAPIHPVMAVAYPGLRARRADPAAMRTRIATGRSSVLEPGQ
jgi:hypothetical protein